MINLKRKQQGVAMGFPCLEFVLLKALAHFNWHNFHTRLNLLYLTQFFKKLYL